MTKTVKVSPCSAAARTLTLHIHDFKAFGEVGGHPDFEHYSNGLVTGLVNQTITPGGVPTWHSNTGSGSQPSLTGAAAFAQWFTDDPINIAIDHTLTLNPISTNVYQYTDTAFFPIDGASFGNYQPYMSGLHNFHFTSAMHAQFKYSASSSPVFDFNGNDDFWVYIDGHLAIDKGGVHGATDGSITLNPATATTLGLSDGGIYRLDFFTANRHTSTSQFQMTLSGLCLNDVP